MSFYNPFSAKPDWGGGIQELLGNLAQMIMIKKMGQDGGQQQLPPPMQMPPPQTGMMGNMMSPDQSGNPTQRPIDTPGNSLLTPQDIETLSSQMPPQFMALIAKLLGEGKFSNMGSLGKPGR